MTSSTSISFTELLHVIRHGERPDAIGAYLSATEQLTSSHIFFPHEQWEVVAKLAAELKAMNEAATARMESIGGAA